MHNKMAHSSKIDIPVLIIFFARSSTLQKVFDSIKEARPSTLLLWQDGPRPGNINDVKGIKECRRIFDDIDWDCTVHTNYHEENMGCDPSTFRAQKWAFSIVEKCIILEDDMVPNQSFYPYCKELLDRYENDERINHICGINFLGISKNCPNDYLFSYYGTGAWASWRRVANEWDSSYAFLDKEYYINNIKKWLPHLVNLETARKRRATGFEWWEVLLAYNSYLNNRLVIIPKVNLVSNIGVTPEATHGSSLKTMSKNIRKVFYMDTTDMVFPMKHPEYVVPDFIYMDELSKINCKGRPWLKRWRKTEHYLLSIIHGDFIDGIKRRWNRRKEK